MEPYETLTGGLPADPQAMAALVEALRQRRGMGELGMLTGDRVLQPFGQNMVKQADSYVDQVQGIRQNDNRAAQTAKYQTGQLEHMGNTLQESIRAANMRDATTRRGQDLDLEAAYARGQRAGKVPNMTDSTRNLILDQANTMYNLKSQIGSFKNDYTQRLGPGAQSKLPNLAAQIGIGTKGSKEAQQWWSEWAKFYTMPTRNALFGATLTPNEQAAWEAVDIHPGMDPDQITTRINRLFKEAEGSAKRRQRAMVSQGFPEEFFKEAYSDTIYGDGGGGDDTPELSDEPPPDFDMDSAVQYLLQNPDTWPQFKEMLESMGVNPGPFKPAGLGE